MAKGCDGNCRSQRMISKCGNLKHANLSLPNEKGSFFRPFINKFYFAHAARYAIINNQAAWVLKMLHEVD